MIGDYRTIRTNVHGEAWRLLRLAEAAAAAGLGIIISPGLVAPASRRTAATAIRQ